MASSSEDFTPARAKKWVAQEAAKARTAGEAASRIKSESEFVAMMTAPGLNFNLPNSLQAHKDLIEVLKQKFQ